MEGRFIESGPREAAFNMALDDALLEYASESPTLRVYSWRPHAISLGYFQKYEEFARFEKTHPIMRRVTGGGAIFHANELTYSITARVNSTSPFHSIEKTYRFVHAILGEALSDLGFSSKIRGREKPVSDIAGTGFCFYKSAAVDVLLAGRKLIGSAQRRRGDKLLMHGSVVIGRNALTPEAAFLTDDDSEAPRLYSEIAARFRKSLGKSLGMKLADSQPSAEELRLAEELVLRKFGNPAWTKRR